jgi:hypothetical protein
MSKKHGYLLSTFYSLREITLSRQNEISSWITRLSQGELPADIFIFIAEQKQKILLMSNIIDYHIISSIPDNIEQDKVRANTKYMLNISS